MTSYTTCINCAADKTACARRRDIRAAIKGAGITALKFRCPERQSLFRIGQRVSVTWTVFYDREDGMDETWPATVISENGTRFLLSIDDVDSNEGTPARQYIKNERLFVKVSPSRIQALDEPDRAICKWCEQAPLPGSECQNRNDYWGFQSLPPGCLLAPEAA